MKKIIALIFCFLFIFTACSDKSEPDKRTELNEQNYATYVGAGEMTLINILVNSNAEIVNEILPGGHLPIDETQTHTNKDGIFALVVSDKYKTLDDLKTKLASVYTAETVEELLTSPARYTEIAGRLYFNTEYTDTDYSVDWSSPHVTATLDENGVYNVEITVKDGNEKDMIITAHAVSENGTLKLEKIYF